MNTSDYPNIKKVFRTVDSVLGFILSLITVTLWVVAIVVVTLFFSTQID